MNKNLPDSFAFIPPERLHTFMEHVDKLQQCCRERSSYVSERFELPQAELRCLMLVGEQQYMTAGEIAKGMNVAKSRVTRIVEGLVQKNLAERITAPDDSRIRLIRLTPEGKARREEIQDFSQQVGELLLGQLDDAEQQDVLEAVKTLTSCMHNVKDMIV